METACKWNQNHSIAKFVYAHGSVNNWNYKLNVVCWQTFWSKSQCLIQSTWPASLILTFVYPLIRFYIERNSRANAAKAFIVSTTTNSMGYCCPVLIICSSLTCSMQITFTKLITNLQSIRTLFLFATSSNIFCYCTRHKSTFSTV